MASRWRLLGQASIFAGIGGAGLAVLGAPAHAAISYGLALMTGALVGLGLAAAGRGGRRG